MTGMRGMERISRRPCGVWASPRRMVSRLRWCSVRRPTSRRRLPTQMRGTAISTMLWFSSMGETRRNSGDSSWLASCLEATRDRLMSAYTFIWLKMCSCTGLITRA